MRIGNLGFNLLALNLLWLLFSTIGLYILGIFPATVALFSAIKQIIIEKDDIPVFKVFWKSFKREFTKANLLGYLVLAIGVILYLDVKVIQGLEIPLLYTVLNGLIIFVIFIYLLIVLYIFPIFVFYDFKFWQYPKYAIIIAIGRPLQTVLILAGTTALLLLYRYFPFLIAVFGMSLFSYIIIKIASSSFPNKI
jgi:uncharacterized membrane protein YesL